MTNVRLIKDSNKIIHNQEEKKFESERFLYHIKKKRKKKKR